jgi:hypothetical protein
LESQAATEFRGDRRQRQIHHRAVEERHERGEYRNRDQGSVGRVVARARGQSACASGARASSSSAACKARWAARMAR